MKESPRILTVCPAFNPPAKVFRQLIADLRPNNDLLIVDDGSTECLCATSRSVCIRHFINKGKGAAIKTAVEYAQQNSYQGIITIDADGQHPLESFNNLKKLAIDEPTKLILAQREFYNDTPLKSLIGNFISRQIFRLFFDIKLNDTQTGLRYYPSNFFDTMLNTKNDRYDFETAVLIQTKYSGTAITTFPIPAIYIDNNSSSQFKPLNDSLKVISTFFRFACSSFISFLIDISLFLILLNITESPNPFVSSVIARIVSCLFNYELNRVVVFGKTSTRKQSFYKYSILAISNSAISGAIAQLLSSVAPSALVKISIDFLLFFSNFAVTRLWVFHKK